MKNSFSILVALLLGLILGGTCMGFLSMRASKVYLELVRTDYRQEQEMLGDKSWKSNKLNEALFHYINVVNIISGTDLKSLNPERANWSFGFPFAAFILSEIKSNVDVEGRGRSFQEGIARAKLGIVLESLDRDEEAQREYISASKLTGMNEVDRVKKFVTEEMGSLNLTKGQHEKENDR